MAASNPTFFFISGAWHTSEYFDEVVGLLAEKGYHSEAMSLPSVGANPPLPDFEKDVEAISKAVTKVINSGKDVILVVHSYGGIPACQAIGAIMDDNEGENGKGKLRRMVWITSFIPQENQSLYTIVGHTPSWWKIEVCSVAISSFSSKQPHHPCLPTLRLYFWFKATSSQSYITN
jgi:alpha-beta hydrolase superfamily lysophospholipase